MLYPCFKPSGVLWCSCRAEAGEREAGDAASALLGLRQQLAAAAEQSTLLLEAQAGQAALTVRHGSQQHLADKRDTL